MKTEQDTLNEQALNRHLRERLEETLKTVEHYGPEYSRLNMPDLQRDLSWIVHKALGAKATASHQNCIASLDAAVELYLDLPRNIPSKPYLIVADALKQRIAACDNSTCRQCGRVVKSPCHDAEGYHMAGPWDFACADLIKGAPRG